MYDIFEKLCKEKGVSAYRVSKATGISTATLSDWKTGKSHPKADKIRKIADYFRVPVDYIQTGKMPRALEFDAGTMIGALDKAAAEAGVTNFEHLTYYTDEATADLAQAMATNPELRALFNVQRDMDPEDLKALYNMALALKRKTERLDSDDPA